MTILAERLRQRYFGDLEHPYRIFENEVSRRLREDHTLLDAGCGRTAPVLAKFVGRARRLVGVDVVDFTPRPEGDIELYQSDLTHVPLENASVDLVMARSVLEHVRAPLEVYREMHRVLRPNGHFIFLTPNLWDYASLVAKVVPNRFHPWIVAKTEGRAEHDVFPTEYRTNTRGAVMKLARQTGFEVESFKYLGQYPGYFMFNGFLFLVATGYERLISKFESLAFLRGWILVVLRKTATAPLAAGGGS